jgi:hypothetical protein
MLLEAPSQNDLKMLSRPITNGKVFTMTRQSTSLSFQLLRTVDRWMRS